MEVGKLATVYLSLIGSEGRLLKVEFLCTVQAARARALVRTINVADSPYTSSRIESSHGAAFFFLPILAVPSHSSFPSSRRCRGYLFLSEPKNSLLSLVLGD